MRAVVGEALGESLAPKEGVGAAEPLAGTEREGGGAPVGAAVGESAASDGVAAGDWLLFSLPLALAPPVVDGDPDCEARAELEGGGVRLPAPLGEASAEGGALRDGVGVPQAEAVAAAEAVLSSEAVAW